MKRIIFALAAAGLLVFSSAVTVRDWWGERLLSRAQAERSRGNIRGAAALYERAVRCGKEEAAVQLARMAFFRRDWEGVRRRAAQVVAINPLHSYIHVLLAYARAEEKTVEGPEGAERVLDECRRAEALDPTNGSVWRSCADLGLRLFVTLSAVPGGEDGARLCRDEALHAYRQALRYDPRGAAGSLAAIAESPAGTGFLLDAVRDGGLPLLREAARLLLEKGLWDDTSEAWWAAASGPPAARDYCRAALEALRRGGEEDEALGAAERCISSWPGDAEMTFLAAQAAASVKGGQARERAGELYRLAAGLDGENGTYQRALGVFLLGRGETAAARLPLEKATVLDPGDAEAWFHLGRAVEKQEGKEAAARCYRKALSLKPGNQKYRKALSGSS